MTNSDRKLSRSSMLEDAPANAAGSGAVAGIGVGPDGEPGRAKSVMRSMLRRVGMSKAKRKKRKES